jgi:hypothetical protein
MYLVAAFGHPRHVAARPLRLETHPQEAKTKFIGHGTHFFQMAVHFATGLVDGFQRRAGKLQLTGRLQRNVGLVANQRDRRVALARNVPAVARGDAFQQRANAAIAFEGRRTQVVGAEAEFLVLGTN